MEAQSTEPHQATLVNRINSLLVWMFLNGFVDNKKTHVMIIAK